MGIQFNKYIVLAVILLLQLNVVQAMVISGLITNEKNEPVPGTIVTEKLSGKTVVADGEGHYLIEVADSNAILVFRSMGYLTKEIKIGINNNVRLLTNVKDL